MGNNQNNTVIEYWTKTGIKISYLFWDLKGKNRFPETPSDLEVNVMFEKCLHEIDISTYQLNIVSDFTSKYKYRFVTLHKRKIAEYNKDRQIQKYSRQSYCLQVVEQVKTVESKKKMIQLQLLLKNVELNQISIKTSLVNVDKFISEFHAQNEFLEVRGIQRFVQLLDSATKINNNGTKTSFMSQIELLKFMRYFSQKYNKEFYRYLPLVKSYPHAILKTYHPINTQIIAYSLDLLSEYSWRVLDEITLIQILQKNRIAINLDSFLSPIIESILQSDSIVSVYHNIKFVNDLMASALTKSDKEILEQNLFKSKYSLVLQDVKFKLQTMFYSIQKTTFINVYQKIFKYSIHKENSKNQQTTIESILQQNSRISTGLNLNNRNSLQKIHQTVIAILIKCEADQTTDLDKQFEENQQLPTYLTQNDRRQFNKVVFDTLIELQKFSRLEFYLQTTQDTGIQVEFKMPNQLTDSRIVQHNLQNYFSKIKHECQQNKSTQVLISIFKKIQFYGIKEWGQLKKFVYEESEQIKKREQELEELKLVAEDKQAKIKTLIKEINDLKTKNQQKTLGETKSVQNNPSSLPLLLPPPPILSLSLGTSGLSNNQVPVSQLPLLPLPPPPILSQSLGTSGSSNNQVSVLVGLPQLPLLPLPALPQLGGTLPKQKLKEKRKPVQTLKNCNYTTISYDKIKNSIFQEIDDTKVQINQNQLVELFAKNTPTQTSPLKRSQSLQSTSLNQSVLTLSSSQKQTIKLLKADRQKNIEIVLIKLKLPKKQIKKILLQCSGKFTSQHTLQVIEKLLPNQEEEQILNSFQANQQDLGISEKFLKELIQVPEYANRIKALIFSHVKEQIYFEIQSKTKKLQQAFIGLRTNNTLKYIIQHCLAIGNYLNGQSLKGGAWGFKLETIERLQEVKSEDKNMNGALYLIKEVWKQFKYPLFDKNQLELYQYISKMPISQIEHEIKELQKYITSIQKACSSKNPQNTEDKIIDFCENFLKQALQKIEQFRLNFEQLKDEYLKCAEYFCENGKTQSSDEFGKKMYKCVLFISNTQKIWKLITERNEKLQKQKAAINNVSYVQPNNPEKNRESAIDLRLSTYELNSHEDLSKTMPNIRQQNSLSKQNGNKDLLRIENAKLSEKSVKKIDKKDQNNEDQMSIRQSHRISSVFDIHKPSKPLQMLNESERKKQLQKIQQQSVNRAMEDVLHRRTMRFQNVSMRFTKVNGLRADTANGGKVEEIPFLTQVNKKAI